MEFLVDKEKHIQGMERFFNSKLDEKTLQIMEVYIDGINEAYRQGVENGQNK